MIAAGVSFFGAFLISDLHRGFTENTNRIKGLLYSLGSATCVGMSYVSLWKMR